MKLWNRKVDISVGGVTVPRELTVNFSVNFSEDPNVDNGEVSIYNLSKSKVNQISKDSTISISAGYDGDYGNIFFGQVLDVGTTWDGVDKVTKIMLGDVTTDYRRLEYSKSFAPGTTNDEILLQLISRAGLGIGEFDTVKNPVYPNGLLLQGNIQNLIKRCVSVSESRFYINKTRVYIKPYNEGRVTGFLLDKDSGLIDSPEATEKEIDGEVYKGFNVRCLLNHQINVDNIVEIKSKTANGMFRVSSGTHEGGNNENEFYTTMEVYPI